MDLQPVPGKLGYELVGKEGVFDKELSPLLPRGLSQVLERDHTDTEHHEDCCEQ